VKAAEMWKQIIFVVILLIEMAVITELVRAKPGTPFWPQPSLVPTAGPAIQQQPPASPPTYHEGTAARQPTSASKITTVTIGTGWYNPNEEMLRVHVYGFPMDDGVNWQVRANHDNSTIIDMPPIDSPKKKAIEFTGSIWAYEYRVTPGQSVTTCRFHFQLDPE
jgi:hypothetical protein